jgi:hypothetical protein
VGIVKDFSIFTLNKAGWKTWSDKPYNHATKKGDIQPTSGDCVLWGSKRSAGDTKLALAAFAKRTAVHNKKFVQANGLYWYTEHGKSNGFTKHKSISLGAADTGSQNGDLRLSWHLDRGSGGWRSGNTKGLNSNTAWRKVVMYGPCL